MKYIIQTLLLFFITTKSPAQEFDTSQQDKNFAGYILRIFEKPNSFTVTDFDCFYCAKKPQLNHSMNFNNLVNQCFLVHESYYENKRMMSNQFDMYYHGATIDSFEIGKYSVDIYKVTVSGYTKTGKIDDYILKNGTSHNQSTFRKLKKKPTATVLYPNQISVTN